MDRVAIASGLCAANWSEDVGEICEGLAEECEDDASAQDPAAHCADEEQISDLREEMASCSDTAAVGDYIACVAALGTAFERASGGFTNPSAGEHPCCYSKNA